MKKRSYMRLAATCRPVRRLAAAAVLILLAATAHAQTMSEVWKSMPDSIVPYLTAQQRQELADRYGTEAAQPVVTALEESVSLDTLTADYLSATMNAAMRLQMRLLRRTDGNPIVCLVKTFYGPAAESEVAFFTTGWQPLDKSALLRPIGDGDLLSRPEGMTGERFDELRRMLVPKLVAMTLLADEPALLCQISMPMVARDEETQIKPILMQTKLKWGGEMLK